MSLLEMLDVVNEELTLEGRRADRVRARLPRRHLRLLRIHDQRHRARPAARHHGVPAHMRHFKDGDELYPRAVAREGISGHQGSGGRSQRLRSHHRSRRLHLRPHRQRAGRQRDPGAERGCRSRHGRRRVHRLRRLRGGLPECLRGAVHRREDHASRPAAAGPARTPRARPAHGGARSTPKSSEAAPTSANAKRCVRRRSSSK